MSLNPDPLAGMITSPFIGTPGVRQTTSPGAPSDAVVFSGNGGNPNASSFIDGFLQPGGLASGNRPSGLLPSLLFNYTGGTTNLGDVDVKLSPGEEMLVSRYPNQIRQFGEMVNRYGIWFYLGTFVFLFFVFGTLWKKFKP